MSSREQQKKSIKNLDFKKSQLQQQKT